MPFRLSLLAGVALIATGPLYAQETAAPAATPEPQQQAAPPASAMPAPAPAAEDTYDGDESEDTIVVTGAKPRGSVIGDIPPENVLTTRDIRATGATSISELLDAVSAQTGSARGRSSGPPVVLLNGQRISGFRELRDLPPEAIERMEILPEEVALKYGYSADQRVVNIVLRRRFDSTTVEARGTLATDGGYAAASAEAGKLLIRNGNRTSVDLKVGGNNSLYESERDIYYDPATGPDPRGARTLTGAAQNFDLTGVINRPVGASSLTVTGEVGRDQGRSRFGLSPFDGSTLTRDTRSNSAALGAALNASKGEWRLSSTANLTYDHSTSDSDRSILGALTDDRGVSTRRTASIDGTANGNLFSLPAGKVSLTAKVGLSHSDIDSEARRRDLVTNTDLARNIAEGSVSLDLPVTDRDSAIGRLGFNVNAGLKELSDFGSLTSVGAGLHWQPAQRLTFVSSWTREEGAPSLQQLGDPVLETTAVPFFDAVNGETVNVTTVSGGNPNLLADRRSVWKLGGNWQPSEKLDLRLRADFVHETIDNPQIGFPAVTPALESAFPGRFTRDPLTNQLTRVDLRPVNAAQSQRDTLRIGFNFSKPLKSSPPSAAQIQALRERFQRNAPQVATPTTGGAGQAAAGAPQQGAGPRAGGGGRFGGGGPGGGNRNGGRLTFSLTDTVTLKDELTIADGLPKLDYLHGEAAGSNGGRPRHQVEGEAGYYNNGLGARLSANWRSATRVDTDSGDLRFGDYSTFDLRLFANLGERFDLVSKSPFFLGSSVRFEVKNIFNARPEVTGPDGTTPPVYFPDRLEPIGRTVGISFRKLFLPTRLFRIGGGGGGGFGGRSGGGGPPPPPPPGG